MGESITPARPLLSAKVRAVNKSQLLLRYALSRITAENADFALDDEEVDNWISIKTLSEPHLEVLFERLAREYDIYLECRGPEVIYLETLHEASIAEWQFVGQSGGQGRYAHVVIRVEPNPLKDYDFVAELHADAIPEKYFDAIDKGIRYALPFGAAGHEMVDVKVTLCDGSYHEGDSDEASFETAGFMAMKEALRKSTPVLLEPVVTLQVKVPEQLTGSVIANLKARGADIIGMVGESQDRMIRAIARLSDVIGFAGDFSSFGHERGSYSIALLRYRPIEDLPPAGDDRIGVTANKPWRPKPRRGAVAVEPPWSESSSA